MVPSLPRGLVTQIAAPTTDLLSHDLGHSYRVLNNSLRKTIALDDNALLVIAVDAALFVK